MTILILLWVSNLTSKESIQTGQGDFLNTPSQVTANGEDTSQPAFPETIIQQLQKPFRLIAADLDDTLIDGRTSEGLTGKTKRLITQVRQREIHVVPITGGGLSRTIERYWQSFSLEERTGEIFFVDGGGRGFQFDVGGFLDENTPIFFVPLSENMTIVRYLIQIAEIVLTELANKGFFELSRILPVKPKPPENPVELTIGNAMDEVSDQVRLDVARFIRERIHKDPMFEGIKVSPSSVAVEIFRADKADAIRFLLDHLGIREEDMLIMGDSQNDDPMFRAFPRATKLYLGKTPYPGLPEEVIHSPIPNVTGAEEALRLVLQAHDARENQNKGLLLTSL